jgi:hypothetical protein
VILSELIVALMAGQLAAAAVPAKGTRAPAASAASGAVLVSTVMAAERIQLPKTRGPIDLVVDPLSKEISLGAPRDLGAVAARVAAGLGNICPNWEVSGGRVVLKCRTNRLQAAIVDDHPRRFLDIHELRGLPRDGADQRLDVFYDPARMGLGSPCPGRGPAARGECALRDGQLGEAEMQLKLAVDSYDRTFAHLRLGDLAARRQDFAGAALMWANAGSGGPFGRLAVARLCELRGDCIAGGADHIFDAGEIAEPVRTELALRGARIDAFAGRTTKVIKRISDLLARSDGGCTRLGRQFCRRLLLAALQDPGKDGGRRALEVYLMLPGRNEPPYAAEMAGAAAARSAELGAPIFAANLLASVAGSVRPADTGPHLLRTAELYLAGKDQPRAQLVLDYAETRLDPRQLSGPRWNHVRSGVVPVNPREAGDRRGKLAREIITAEAVRDLANAMTALAQLRRELQ